MAFQRCLAAATRSRHVLLAKLSSTCPARLTGSPLTRNWTSDFVTSPRTFPRILMSSVAEPAAPEPSEPAASEAAPEPAVPEAAAAEPAAPEAAAAEQAAAEPAEGEPEEGPPTPLSLLAPEDRPRMPSASEEAPKPTTAIGVVEAHLGKLWRDFFTNPHNWEDNRGRPKYADFKNKVTKEGIWIFAKFNPPWVRTELSMMTNFPPVPFDDPLWMKKEEEERREYRPPKPPGSDYMDTWFLNEKLSSSTSTASTPEPTQESQEK